MATITPSEVPTAHGPGRNLWSFRLALRSSYTRPAHTACPLLFKASGQNVMKDLQPKLKASRSRRHMNGMKEGTTGIQNELQANIKASSIMNGVQGVGRTKYNQIQ